MSPDPSHHKSSSPLHATVYVGRWPEIPAVEVPGIPTGRFSPTTSVLISGPTEAILVDAQYLKDDVRDLGDLIERTGKSLTTIYITHAHADHYGGARELQERFPNARTVALPDVIQNLEDTLEMQTAQWAMLFGDKCVSLDHRPEPIEGRTLHVDGFSVDIIQVKQADINPTSIVHVPEIGLVVAGDAIYNEIHPMLGLSTPEQWNDWLATIDLVESLEPRMIVAGHRRPDGDDYAVADMITETRSYIEDFAAECSVAADADALIEKMVSKYPTHGNRWTLEFSALSVISQRDTGASLADVTP
ncbi:MBL fold metallo-hydrolase [Gordonia polyisoprenivorans]|uniref:MBL fold metallo-hydrolase n=1 Tax=Gordonia polyisoprenivorans TaxID=84595 RepID=UPI001AD63D41|nr:MBL fold metallo-hydrolase [Gordonia polyisoprenivorans]QTI71292.1 MBL fold metallo-hydrolase [Gordonia polyisoprenivorans]